MSNLATKLDFGRLKAEVDKMDVEKLKTVATDLSKVSNVVDNDVVKKTLYDKLVTKVNGIDSSGFAVKTQYDTEKSGLEKKINGTEKKVPDTSALETEGKIHSIIGLATTAALTAVENKIPNLDLVKKTD